MNIFPTALTVGRLYVVVHKQAENKMLLYPIVEVYTRSEAPSAVARNSNAADVGFAITGASNEHLCTDSPPRGKGKRKVWAGADIIKVERIFGSLRSVDDELKVGERDTSAQSYISVEKVGAFQSERGSHRSLIGYVFVHVELTQRHVKAHI